MSNIKLDRFYISNDPYDLVTKISRTIHNLIVEGKQPNQEIIFLMIGTPKIYWDSLGPLTGSLLEESNHFKKEYFIDGITNFSVYGTIQRPVHAQNLYSTVSRIYEIHKNPFIIAVDASFSYFYTKNNILISNEPIKPGLGVGKDLLSVGDISIRGIVGSDEVDAYNLSYSELKTMALLISTAINCVLSIKQVQPYCLLHQCETTAV
ncbi:spore protease YyaC [Lacrimispora amygdalina]|uniref:spore protease YyaC n=1 Tax=Lacrimispora amygdalina TaxID=253257 RepID=UPI000BE42694|nr:spore protease YyaC [Lacrimispora amygdalina]